MIRLTDRLRELGADSLDLVEFQVELETVLDDVPEDVAYDLSAEDALSVETVEDLLRLISRHRKDDAA